MAKKPRKRHATMKCLACKNPKQPAVVRGLCRNHYAVTWRAIKAKKTTEAAVMAAGLMLPAAPGRRTDLGVRLQQLGTGKPASK